MRARVIILCLAGLALPAILLDRRPCVAETPAGQGSGPTSQPAPPKEGNASITMNGTSYSYGYRIFSPSEELAANAPAPRKIASAKDALLAMYACMYAGDVKAWRALWKDAPGDPKFTATDEQLRKGWKTWLRDPHRLLYEITYKDQDIFITEQSNGKRAKFFFKKEDGQYWLNRDLARDDFAQMLGGSSFDPAAGKRVVDPAGNPSTKPASRPASSPASAPAENPYWKVAKINDYFIAVPKDWPQQQMPGLGNAAFVGDGIAANAKDEKGDPIQVEITVDRGEITKDSAAAIAKQDQQKTAKQFGRPIPGPGHQEQPKVISSALENHQLSDGTAAAFTRILMVKQGPRRSLQLKLFVKDKLARCVMVSAWITTGMKTHFIDKSQSLERLLKAHMLTLCFDAEKLDTTALARLYGFKATSSQPASAPAGKAPAGNPGNDSQVLRPLFEKPRSLDGLYKRLEGKNVAAGFIGKPIRVGSSGLTESVVVERVVDKTNMIARITFPELRTMEMAPGDYHPGSNIKLPLPKAWQSGEERVWITGIDTSNVVDDTVIYLADPIKVVDTVKTNEKTIYRVAKAVQP